MLQAFLQDYGYLALFIGTFFEGETILLLAGFLASRGYLDINLVILTAASGGYCGDQLWYLLGRRKGRQILARKPQWEALGEKALNHLRRYPDIWVLGFRFVYGLRTVMPVAIGISGYPPLRFLFLNAISAIIWAIVLGATAFHLGSALELVLEDIKHYEILVISGLIIIGGGLYGWRRYRNRRSS